MIDEPFSKKIALRGRSPRNADTNLVMITSLFSESVQADFVLIAAVSTAMCKDFSLV